jgi:hypothetical protein
MKVKRRVRMLFEGNGQARSQPDAKTTQRNALLEGHTDLLEGCRSHFRTVTSLRVIRERGGRQARLARKQRPEGDVRLNPTSRTNWP